MFSKKLESYIKRIPETTKKVCSLEREFRNLSFVDSLNDFNFNTSTRELSISFTHKDGTEVVQSVDLSSLVDVADFTPQIVVQNYDELALITNASLFEFAEVIDSQGTFWLPGSLGGSFYGAGLYYWNGAEWINDKDEIFNAFQQFTIAQNSLQNEINSLRDEIETLKEINNSVGTITFEDTQYTEANRLVGLANQLLQLPNNKGVISNKSAPDSAIDWINDQGELVPEDGNGDTFLARITFEVDSALNNRNLRLFLDIGDSTPIDILGETKRLARGAGNDTSVKFEFKYFTQNTFLANNGKIMLEVDGDFEIYNIFYVITRIKKA